MRVSLSSYGSRGGNERMVGRAVQPGALGAEVRVCALPDCAAAEGCDALAATDVVPSGVWR